MGIQYPSGKSSDQSQKQQISVGALSTPQNPPKSNNFLPTSQTRDQPRQQEPSNRVVSQGYSAKDNHDLQSHRSSNHYTQVSLKQNPGKNDSHPPTFNPAQSYQPQKQQRPNNKNQSQQQQPAIEVSSKDHQHPPKKKNQSQVEVSPKDHQHPPKNKNQSQHPPKNNNQSQHQPPLSNDTLRVPSIPNGEQSVLDHVRRTAYGNRAMPHRPTVQTDRKLLSSQPVFAYPEYPINEPVLAYPDLSCLLSSEQRSVLDVRSTTHGNRAMPQRPTVLTDHANPPSNQPVLAYPSPSNEPVVTFPDLSCLPPKTTITITIPSIELPLIDVPKGYPPSRPPVYPRKLEPMPIN
ncbi:hypothetical protein PTKIN_Ptkin16aG0482900 [Pterospermum kingtungense]